MSTLNLAIAQDVESSKDSEINVSSQGFDISSSPNLRYVNQSKQIADLFTSFISSIPKEDFKSDILVTKYSTKLDTLKDKISEVLTFVSRDVYDSITLDFNSSLKSVDKEELANIILESYNSSDSSNQTFKTSNASTDKLSHKPSLKNSKSDNSVENGELKTSKSDSNVSKFKTVNSSSDFNLDNLSFSETSSLDSSISEFKTSKPNTDSSIENLNLDNVPNSDSQIHKFEVRSSSVSDSQSSKLELYETSSDSSDKNFNISSSESLDTSLDSFETKTQISDTSNSKLVKFKDSHKTDESNENFRVVEVLTSDSTSKDYVAELNIPVIDSDTTSESLISLASEIKSDSTNKSVEEFKASFPDSELPLSEEIKQNWSNLLTDTSSKLKAPFKSAEERFKNRTSNPEAWIKEANDIALSVTSEVFNGGVRMVRAVDGELVKAITDLPGYVSSIVRSSIVNPTNKFIYDISNSVSDLIRTVVDLPTTIVDTAVGVVKKLYSGYLDNISDRFSNLTQGLETRLANFVSDLFFRNASFSGLNKEFDYKSVLSEASFKDLTPDNQSQAFVVNEYPYESKLSSYVINELSSSYDSPSSDSSIKTKMSELNPNIKWGELKGNEFSDDSTTSESKSLISDSTTYSSLENSLGKYTPSSSALTRGSFKTSSQEFLSEAYWDISIVPHNFNNSNMTPPNIIEYFGNKLPIISFDLTGEMVDNSDFELYNSFMMSYPSMYSRMNRLTISLPEIISRTDNGVTSSLRRFKEDYIRYVTGSRLAPSFRDFRYCSYEIEVTKFTQTWHTVKTWKLLGIPEFSSATRGGSDSSIEISEISFNIVGEDLKTSEQVSRENEVIEQNNESTYNDLLAEKEYYRNLRR